MASKPPSDCCSAGIKHEGEVSGKFITIGENINTYVSGDKSSPNVLLFLTDILGPEFKNSQLVADSYAAQGYYVIVPDLFYGQALKLGESVTPEFLSKHGLAQTEPIVLSTLRYIKSELKPKFIASLGHCFGAKYAVRVLNGQVDVGAVAHPSFVDISEIEHLTKPLFIAAAEHDTIFTDEYRAKTEAKLKEIKATYYVSLTSSVAHGFAVRGDPTDKWNTIAKNKFFNDSIWWFKLFE